MDRELTQFQLSHIVDLKSFLESSKASYLRTDLGRYQRSNEEALSEEDRDEIDTFARLKLKDYAQRLRHLESYETKRQQSKQHFRFNKSQATALNTHRKGILLSLGQELRSTSKLLLSMQETRLSRSRDIEIGDYSRRLASINVKSAKFELKDEVSERPELQELSQEQLQILQTENNEILNAKLEDLAKVENIHKSVVEIAQLEAQLSSHLQVQSENISNLVSDHDMTEVDLVEGNKILKKAKSKGNYASKVVMFTALLLGFILLFFDFIN